MLPPSQSIDRGLEVAERRAEGLDQFMEVKRAHNNIAYGAAATRACGLRLTHDVHPTGNAAADLVNEIYQVTSALKHLGFGKHVAVLTDARFSGVSTGACIGHVGPEALAGGPVGKVRDGDRIRIVIDRNRLEGTVDLVGEGGAEFWPEEGARVLARPDLAPDPGLPADTRLWAALQAVSGGTWGGCVYDVEAIVSAVAMAR